MIAPGPRGGLLGVYREIRRDPFAFLVADARRYPRISRFRIGPAPIVHLSDPGFVHRVLVENPDNYGLAVDRIGMKVLFRDSLLTNAGPTWKPRRRLVQGAFGHAAIARYAEATAEVATAWADRAAGELDVFAEMMALTEAVLGRVLLSDHVDPRAKGLGTTLLHLKSEALDRFYRAVPPLWVPIPANIRYRRRRDAIDQVLGGIVADRRRNGHPGDDVLKALIDGTDDDQVVIEEMISLYAAAHEPTANLLTFVWLALSRHRPVRERLRAEEPGWLRAVIEETLRKWPPVWAFSKGALGADSLGGYDIRRGDSVVFSPYILHRLPDVWDDPERFDPERFTDPARKAARPPGAYIPFGVGPKHCVGQHFAMLLAQTVVATVSARMELRAVGGEEQPIDFTTSTAMRPLGAVPMTVSR